MPSKNVELNTLSHADTLTRLSTAQKKIAKIGRQMLKDGLRVVSTGRQPTHYQVFDSATGKWVDVPDGFDLDKLFRAAKKTTLTNARTVLAS